MDSQEQFGENFKPHLAICPLDGRYKDIGQTFSNCFSEYALVKNRVFVEVKWLLFLLEKVKFFNDFLNGESESDARKKILAVSENFCEKDFFRVKEIEKVTNHDVKAVEIFVGERLKAAGLANLVSIVHFGCTSEDINNVSYALMQKSGLEIWRSEADKLVEKIDVLAKKYAGVAMLAHTHGQSATPTTVGKEFAVFAFRLSQSLKHLDSVKIYAKFNGATGNYSALSLAMPDINWEKLAQNFIESFGLNFNPYTTQIESHDYICHLCDAMRHFDNVLLDLDQDMWLYISMGYFKQIAIKNEVGSSTMPHKINPIKFENSESNIDTANAILLALSNKLAKSRMQRDLSDSSSLRNLGLGYGYSLQAITQTSSGLDRVEVCGERLAEELDSKWEVLAEPIQTVLRKYAKEDAYSRLKEFSRGKTITKNDIENFVDSLEDLSDGDRKILKELSPNKYIGLSEKLAKNLKINK